MSRKFQWQFTAQFPNKTISQARIKLVSRPNLTIEETPLADGSFQVIQESAKWESITTTFYGVGHPIFDDDNPFLGFDSIRGVKGTGKLTLLCPELPSCPHCKGHLYTVASALHSPMKPIEEWDLEELTLVKYDPSYDGESVDVTWDYSGVRYHNLSTPNSIATHHQSTDEENPPTTS